MAYKYVKKIRGYYDRLLSKEFIESNDSDKLFGFIMDFRHFLRETKLGHKDFPAVQKMLVDLFWKDAEIISNNRKKNDREQERDYADCYTNLLADLKEAETLYIKLQRKKP